jgi:hypothetical protein
MWRNAGSFRVLPRLQNEVLESGAVDLGRLCMMKRTHPIFIDSRDKDRTF